MTTRATPCAVTSIPMPMGATSSITVNPGLYPGRTEHIHVKVQAPGGPVLTSQLFFPNAAGNTSDVMFNRALLGPPRRAMPRAGRPVIISSLRSNRRAPMSTEPTDPLPKPVRGWVLLHQSQLQLSLRSATTK